MKGADGWGVVNMGGGGGRSLTAGPIVNGLVVNGRVNDSVAFIFGFGW